MLLDVRCDVFFPTLVNPDSEKLSHEIDNSIRSQSGVSKIL